MQGKFKPSSPSDEILRENEPVDAPAPLFHVVQHMPEIAPNTGSLGRTCVGTRCMLHLTGKLGFRITDRNLKRAGLDYWDSLRWRHHDSWEEFRKTHPKISDARIFYFSSKATKLYTDAHFELGDVLVFGSESNGLPDEMLENAPPENLLKIPILGPVRGYNVATSAAIVVFEALRQVGVKE